jgi:hypothetical protein
MILWLNTLNPLHQEQAAKAASANGRALTLCLFFIWKFWSMDHFKSLEQILYLPLDLVDQLVQGGHWHLWDPKNRQCNISRERQRAYNYEEPITMTQQALYIFVADLEKSGIFGSWRKICLSENSEEHFQFFTDTSWENLNLICIMDLSLYN